MNPDIWMGLSLEATDFTQAWDRTEQHFHKGRGLQTAPFITLDYCIIYAI